MIDIAEAQFHEVVDIWPKMQPREFAELVADIKANGLREPIWTYQGEIIDGRHRYLACKEAGVEPRYQEWDGQGSLILFVASLNQHRRHLDAGQRAMIAVEIEAQLAKEAKQNMSLGGIETHSNQHTNKVSQGLEIFLTPATSDPAMEQKTLSSTGTISKPAQEVTKPKSPEIKPIHAAKEAAKVAGTNPHYVTDAKKIIEQAPELKPLVMERAISLPDAKRLRREPKEVREKVVNKIISGKTKSVRMALSAIKQEELEVTYNNIVVEPNHCKILDPCAIKDLPDYVEAESLDAIITDPPYPREFLPVYTDLAHFAIHALKPGGSLIAMVGQSYLPEILDRLRKEPLAYHWLACYHVPGSTTKQWQRNLGISWKPLLWFVKGEYAGSWKKDMVFIGEQKDKTHHEWGQPVNDMINIIEHFTQPGQLICDPFVGGGSTAVAAVKSKRRFIGCDIDPQCVNTTRERTRTALEMPEEDQKSQPA